MTSKRQVRPTSENSAHTTRGTTASTRRWVKVNLGLALGFTPMILLHAPKHRSCVHEYRSQRSSSGSVARLPYMRMPTR